MMPMAQVVAGRSGCIGIAADDRRSACVVGLLPALRAMRLNIVDALAGR